MPPGHRQLPVLVGVILDRQGVQTRNRSMAVRCSVFDIDLNAPVYEFDWTFNYFSTWRCLMA